MKIVSKSLRRNFTSQAKYTFDDFLDFAKNNINVTTPSNAKGFAIRDYQERICSAIFEKDNVIVLAPRQAGLTTTLLACAFWESIAYEKSTVVYFCSTYVDAVSLCKKAADMLSAHTPVQLSKILPNTLQFSNQSKLIFCYSPDALKGLKIDKIFCDNFPYLREDYQQEIILECFHKNAAIRGVVFAGCAKKKYDYFHDLWMTATQNTPNPKAFYPIRVYLTELPFYSMMWEQKMKQMIAPSVWKCFYECEFLN